MRCSLILAGMTWVTAGAAVGQETTGSIRGRLVGTAGPIVDAQVSATSSNLLGVRRIASFRDGVFQLLELPPGIYALRIAAIGYRPLLIEGVEVLLGHTSGLGDRKLEAAAVNLSEIIVTAPRVTLDPVRTSIGSILRAQDYQALPGDRDYLSLLPTLPHLNASSRGDGVNAVGSTGLENMYFIDGVNVTSGRKAESGTMLPSNLVRQIEVRTGGYEAQYGKALGAVVNAVTYTGTNRLEGNIFGYLTAGRPAEWWAPCERR